MTYPMPEFGSFILSIRINRDECSQIKSQKSLNRVSGVGANPLTGPKGSSFVGSDLVSRDLTKHSSFSYSDRNLGRVLGRRGANFAFQLGLLTLQVFECECKELLLCKQKLSRKLLIVN